jgi:alpha-amylase
MGVLMQVFYRSVPSPADGDASIPWWWDRLARHASSFKAAGFTAVWLPPVLKGASGRLSIGYDPFDDYDIGSKDQKGTIPTRYGIREQLQRCVAILRANGLDVYLDMVEHHRSGDPGNFIFRYLGADGVKNEGRFPKNPLNFVPNVLRDPELGGPPKDDFPFGRELAPINARPHHYVFDGLIAAADWLTRALDVQGYRLDDVKGISTDFLLPFLQSKSMNGKFAVGEYFDGNLARLQGWVSQQMKGRAHLFDFPSRFVLANMCNNPGHFNMASLDHAGLAGVEPQKAVTFVENHDTDQSDPVISNKMLGYAYILTSEGYPCVFYRDYSSDPNCFGLGSKIDNLIWIHEKLASGPTQQRWKDFNIFSYERLGGPHLLVGLNNGSNAEHRITVDTDFGPHVALHDYSRHAHDAVTDSRRSVTIVVPRNDDGLGYVCYSRENIEGRFTKSRHVVTQEFSGATDLDISPASEAEAVHVGRVWCEGGTPIRVVLDPDLTNWTTSSQIVMELRGPDGAVLGAKDYTKATPEGTAFEAESRTMGYHSFILTGSNLPENNLHPRYSLNVTYSATQDLD